MSPTATVWITFAVLAVAPVIEIVASLLIIRVHPRATLALGRLTSRVPLFHFRARGLGWCALAHADLGQASAALEYVERMLALESRRRRRDPSLRSVIVDVLVTIGEYRSAVQVGRLRRRDRRRGLRFMLYDVTTQINRAEALYNLGRTKAALRILKVIEPAARRFAVPRAARHLLATWLFASSGDGARAVSEAALIVPADLTRRYLPEVLYASAAAAAACGDLHAALVKAEKGSEAARRASSRWNGSVLEASLWARIGDRARARSLIEGAFRQNERFQAAPGLVLLGQLCERDGDTPAARIAYEAALRLDPQSYACLSAKEGLLRLG